MWVRGTLYDPCDEISVGKSSREGNEVVVTRKRQAKWFVKFGEAIRVVVRPHNAALPLVLAPFRYFVLPWGDVCF